MDFTEEFNQQFQPPGTYHEVEVTLNKKLQDTRHSLQESISETDQLIQIIDQLYAESRVENVATSELVLQITTPLVRNVPLPRNADNLPLSEKAGYALYYLKFLGFAFRKSIEEYHTTKDHLEGIHKTIGASTVETTIKRSGALKVPELDGQKEMKRSSQAKPPPTPPITPTKSEKVRSSKK